MFKNTQVENLGAFSTISDRNTQSEQKRMPSWPWFLFNFEFWPGTLFEGNTTSFFTQPCNCVPIPWQNIFKCGWYYFNLLQDEIIPVHKAWKVLFPRFLQCYIIIRSVHIIWYCKQELQGITPEYPLHPYM